MAFLWLSQPFFSLCLGEPWGLLVERIQEQPVVRSRALPGAAVSPSRRSAARKHNEGRKMPLYWCVICKGIKYKAIRGILFLNKSFHTQIE